MSSTTTLRRRAALALVVLALGALAACQPIVVTDDGVESHATMAASPTTVMGPAGAVAAIEIRLRDCHTLRFETTTKPPVNDWHLRPVAIVTAADGKTIFSNFRPPGSEDGVYPAGYRVIDGGTDDAHRIIVPVAGAKTPLTIGTACTAYGGVGSGGPFNTYSLPTCRTSNRTCAATRPGQGTYSD